MLFGKSFRSSMLPLLSLLCVPAAAMAYQTDATTHVVTVSPGSNASAVTTDLSNALAFLTNRADKATTWTLKLNPGKYNLTRQVRASGLENTVVTSADPANPAQLIKISGWSSSTSGEYLLSFSFCKKVQLWNMEFYGQTSYANDTNPYWPDQGVYFGSCNVVRVDGNKFYNFGNAALRVVTDTRDPVPGVNSFKTMVANNTFNNIYQTATTSTDTVHGGTAYSTWINNTFLNLRGSVKFASRTVGAKHIEFIKNVINGGDHFGLEINNYDDFLIKGNTIQNIKENAINIYMGSRDGLSLEFPWGSDFTISQNTIKNVGRGIRYSHEPFPTGYQNVPTNLVIDSNILSDILATESWIPAIGVSGGIVDGVKVTNNKMYNIANKKYISILNGCLNVSVLGNMVDGLAYGPQPSTASNTQP